MIKWAVLPWHLLLRLVNIATFFLAIVLLVVVIYNSESVPEVYKEYVRNEIENFSWIDEESYPACELPKIHPLCHSFFAEFLYFQSDLGGTDYSYSAENSALPTYPTNAKINRIGSVWGPGFRLGGSYRFDKMDIDVGTRYTYLQTNKSSTTYGTQQVLRGIVPTFNSVGGTSTDYNLLYNDIELGCTKVIPATESLFFKPGAGIKGSFFTLKQTSTFFGSTLSTSEYELQDKVNSYGVGPYLSIDSKWLLPASFYLDFFFLGALEYTYLTSYSKEQLQPGIPLYSIKQKQQLFLPNLDLNFSLGWFTYFDEEKKRLSFQIGYEVDYFFNQNQQLYVYETNPSRFVTRNNNLSLSGLTLQAAIRF